MNRKIWQVANSFLLLLMGVGVGMILPPHSDFGFFLVLATSFAYAISTSFESREKDRWWFVGFVAAGCVLVGVVVMVLRIAAKP
jgi:hypothetical protein